MSKVVGLVFPEEEEDGLVNGVDERRIDLPLPMRLFSYVSLDKGIFNLSS